MRKRFNGFTIIEVSLFLAITGLLFLGVTIGVQSSVFRQRFNDSVQNFSEFLRNIYAETMNVQSADSGRSGQAIYGKLVTFGEKVGFSGEPVDGNQAFVYDVVGNISDVGTGNILEALRNANADVIAKDSSTTKLAGIVESYRPKWSAQIQRACTSSNCFTESISATLLIVRHPRSGTVYTYVMNSTIPINYKMRTPTGNLSILPSLLNETNFKPVQIDFCVNPEGKKYYSGRADVRINENARNSSAIEVIYEDTNPCR